jgi:hypothetical protein
MNLYYKIWVDGIIRLKSLPANKGLWKFYSMVLISFAMALNLAMIMAIAQRNIFKNSFYDLHVSIFNDSQLNSFTSFFVLFFLLPLFLNYFLIFRNNRYEKLIKKYKSYNGKLCIAYLLISYFLPFVLLLIGYFLER